MNIITNNQPRDLMHLCDFSASDQDKIRKEYDWMEPDDLECNYGFFKYHGCIYHLQEFLTTDNLASGALTEWDGCVGDSAYSGTLIRLVKNDCDRVIVGRYYC